MPKIEKLRNTLDRLRRLQLSRFSQDHPNLYFTAVLAAALLGYLALLFAPITVLLGAYGIMTVFSRAGGNLDYQLLIICSALVSLGISITYHICALRFRDNIGLRLKWEEAPQLYSLIKVHNREVEAVSVQEIQVTPGFELRVATIPSFGLPFHSKHILVIGLAFLQSLPKQYFQQAISAKLLQHSKHGHLFTHWLAQLPGIWMLYAPAFGKRDKVGDRILSRFFSWYAPFYRKLATPLAQRSDMLGEAYALAHYNDMDILEGIQAQALAELFLRKYYWPSAKKKIEHQDVEFDASRLYDKIPSSLARNLSPATADKLINQLFEADSSNGPFPPLQQRIANIGHTRTVPAKVRTGDAGKYYLGNHYETTVYTVGKYRLGKAQRSAPNREKKINAATAPKGLRILNA